MHLQSFIKYLSLEKRFSAHTVDAYKVDLNQFQKFLNDNEGDLAIEKADHHMIRGWLFELKNPSDPKSPSLSSRSISRKISSLRTYFKFLKRKGIIDKDPMLKIKAPKVEKRLPEYVETGEMKELLEYLEQAKGFLQIRDRLIIELLYSTGMRRAELLSLKEADIDFGSGQLKILGKGNKERIMPLHSSLLDLIDEYLDLKSEEFENASPYLIVNDKGEKPYPKFINNAVGRMISMVSSIGKKSPHVLRHTFATHLLNNGSPLNAIKELLGHSNLAATQVYTHGQIEELKNIYKQSHPKS